VGRREHDAYVGAKGVCQVRDRRGWHDTEEGDVYPGASETRNHCRFEKLAACPTVSSDHGRWPMTFECAHVREDVGRSDRQIEC
jgi:hypothetical protein